MIEFSVSDKDDAKIIVTNKHDDITNRQVYDLGYYKKHINTNFSDVNRILNYLSIQETEALFTFYDDIKHELFTDRRPDELNVIYSNIGVRLLAIVDHIKLVDICKNFSIKSEEVKINNVGISFDILSTIIRIFIPVIVCVRDKSIHYSKNPTINDIAVIKILNPLLESYFSKDKGAISIFISRRLESVEGIEERLQRKTGGIRKQSHLNTAIVYDIINTVLLYNKSSQEILRSFEDRFMLMLEKHL